MIHSPRAPDPPTLHALFAAQAARTPHATAVVHGDERISYRELDRRAGRVARRLAALGVGPETVVGVCAGRDPWLVAALLGVLRAGGAYLPLDPAYPAERLRRVVAETGADLVVARAGAAEAVGLAAGRRLLLEEVAAAEDGDDDAPPATPAVHPDGVAYVIHTSGSTGRPKGVMVTHRGAAALVGWMRGALIDEERGAVLAATSVSFDVSVAELWGTLCWGGTVVLVENALSLATAPPAEAVRVVSTVPSAAAELLRLGAIPPSVRTVCLGGEPVPAALARGLYAAGVARVLNLYGPTEDTTYSTCALLPRDAAGTVPVGRGVAGSTPRVLDAALRPVAAGTTGEIWVAGEGVARGYAGRPALTAERFLPDPLAERPGARMYRTGDLGRLRPDGELECLGRVDHQVKVRGFRVEPEEVEAALREHPEVADAAVAARPAHGGGTELAGYVVPHDGAAAAPAALRAWLAARLPDHMVPATLTVLAALPRTPSGKTDRRALPAPDAPAADDAGYVAPRTDTERRVAELCAAVLGLPRLGVEDDFFARGGHSLRAAQVAARLRESEGVEVPLVEVFAHPTPAALAARVEAARAERRAAAAPIPRVPRDGPLPLSGPQEAIWFFQHLSPEMRAYVFCGTVRFRGRLEVEALRGALEEIVRRHEVFRTVFVAEDGEPVQRVLPPWPVDLPVDDLSDLPPAEREAALAARLDAAARLPFDPARLPLVRWTLFRMGAEDHVLLVAEHHYVHDGWSFGVFLHELRTLLDAYGRGLPSPLPEPEIQFADFAAWQQGWLRGPEAAAQRAWWRATLSPPPPPLELPTDRPRPPAATFTGWSRRVRLEPAVARAAREFSRRHGVTLYTTMLAAFQALMGRLSGQAEFCVGGGVAGRERRETEGVIGMLVNTVPLRADLHGDPTFAELVGRVRATALGAFAHQAIPFHVIVEEVHPARSLDRLPLYQVAFNFHHAPYPPLELPELGMEVTEALPNGSAKFDLQVIVIPRAHQGAGGEDDVTMIWEHSTDLFDDATAERFAAEYGTLLAAALRDPACRVSRLPLLEADEEARLAAGWNASARPFPRDAALGELFAAQAARTPHAPAVLFGAELLTYAELDARAVRLARLLRRRGVLPGARVGVCLARSTELVVATLAVVRAGAAYVPLDPGYPRERLAEMAADAGVALAVTDAAHAALLPPGTARVCLDADAAEVAREPNIPLPPVATGDSLAYVVYTSGSTGRPKGVAVPHRGVARLVCGSDYLALGPDDRVAQLSNASFDAFTWELWGALLNGAALVGVPREVSLAPAALAAFLAARGVSALFLTTALFNQVALEVPAAFRGVRAVLFGGEACDPAAVRRVLEGGAPERLLHVYGPTESTTFASWHAVDAVPAGAVTVPIGLPVANTTLHVLDAHGRPTAPGCEGELYVGGDGLAWGYLGRAAATAERFGPDPFAARPGGRLYRTGDRVRRLAAGPLEFVGRTDRQVKVRGFRIEPGEVEAALCEHPAVGACVVTAPADAAGTRELVAYVVPAPGGEAADPAALRGWLAARLPAHMVPAAYTPLDRLPLTPNGKVDHARLPAPSHRRTETAAFVAPRTAVETRLAALWCRVLGTERVGLDDDFFALGGHSLRATRVAAHAREAFGVEVPVRDFFDHPTLRALAAAVEGRMATAVVPDDALLRAIESLEGMSEDEVARLLGEHPG